MHRRTGNVTPYSFCEQCGFFYIPFKFVSRGEEDSADGYMSLSQWHNHLNSDQEDIEHTASMIVNVIII